MSEESFGDVTSEYLALRRDCGLVFDHHEAVVVSGPDAIPFLQGLVSQDLSQPAGSVHRSFLLSPQGKLKALLWLLIGEGEVVLITDAELAHSVAADLTRFRIRVDVDIRVEDSSILELWGPRSSRVLEVRGIPTGDGWQPTPTGWIARVPMGDLDRYLLTGHVEQLLVDSGATRCGALAATAIRIEAGEPMMGLDVDEKTIPQETGLVPEAVSFTKGCYLGQELVARIDSRGHVNRQLRGLLIAANVLPPAGAAIFAGDRSMGELGSVGESLTLRRPVAMALLRRELADGDSVEIRWKGGEVAATVSELPLDHFTDR